ncbi:MAG: DNA-binding NarL/FixJ family response regulator [Chlamydiales bacterium]|jgi:DNA-binding NarL/FixJ family response regulator
MMNTKLYLIEDQALIRAGFKNLLNQREALEVIGDSGDARASISEIAELRPDVVLLDITMPGLSGIDAIKQIRRVSPRSRIIMLTHHESQNFVTQALREGADGYVSKDSSEEELSLAIDSVLRGTTFVSPRAAGGLFARVGGTAEQPLTAPTPIDSLTHRERETFQLLAVGMCNKEVARHLGVSLGTAKKHRENLQRKLDCHSAAELARLAIREGLLCA